MPLLGDSKTITRFAWLPTELGLIIHKHRRRVWLRKVVDTYTWVTYSYGHWLYIGTDLAEK